MAEVVASAVTRAVAKNPDIATSSLQSLLKPSETPTSNRFFSGGDNTKIVGAGVQVGSRLNCFDARQWGWGAKQSLGSGKLAPRRVTDLLCLVVFAICNAILIAATVHGLRHGRLNRLHMGLDFLGNICGDGDFVDRPFLFYCRGQGSLTSGADLAHPICVSSCPTSTRTWHSCYAGVETKIRTQNNATGSFEETMSYNFAKTEDYPSYTFLGAYCMPKAGMLLHKQVRGVIAVQQGNRALAILLDVADAWHVLLLSGIMAVAAGYAYLLSLQMFAGAIVRACMFLPSVVLTLAGFFLLSTSNGVIDASRLVGDDTAGYTTTGNYRWDSWIGGALILCGGAFGFFAICSRRTADLAVGCVEAACDCMRQLPTLLSTPLITFALQAIMALVVGSVVLHLLACGRVRKESLAHYVSTPSSEINGIHGVFRSFEYSDLDRCYIIFSLFMLLWLVETATALGQFMLIYAVEIWYFTPYRRSQKVGLPSGLLVHGAYLGATWHLGSLAMGSAIIAVFRFLQAFAWLAARSEDMQKNALTSAIAKALTCCFGCLAKMCQEFNKCAYMDVAMHANTFCTAAAQAFRLLTGEIAGVTVLYGVGWVLQVAGIGTISIFCACVTYFTIGAVPAFSNPGLSSFVPDPTATCAAAGVVGAVVAYNFMSVFDSIMDTILYCFVIDKSSPSSLLSFDWNNYAPPSLRKLLEEHGTFE